MVLPSAISCGRHKYCHATGNSFGLGMKSTLEGFKHENARR
jgi:hypothetical protein